MAKLPARDLMDPILGMMATRIPAGMQQVEQEPMWREPLSLVLGGPLRPAAEPVPLLIAPAVQPCRLNWQPT
jgi:hypothetical protein